MTQILSPSVSAGSQPGRDRVPAAGLTSGGKTETGGAEAAEQQVRGRGPVLIGGTEEQEPNDRAHFHRRTENTQFSRLKVLFHNGLCSASGLGRELSQR